MPDLQVDVPENHKGSCVRPPCLATYCVQIGQLTNCYCLHLAFWSTLKTSTARAWPTASRHSPQLHNRAKVDSNIFGKIEVVGSLTWRREFGLGVEHYSTGIDLTKKKHTQWDTSYHRLISLWRTLFMMRFLPFCSLIGLHILTLPTTVLGPFQNFRKTSYESRITNHEPAKVCIKRE